MLEGFYKCEYSIAGNVGRSVMYVHDGHMLGGNSAFVHIGTYDVVGEEIVTEIESRRFADDPNYPSLLGSDVAQINVRGRADPDGIIWRFSGGSPQMPGLTFRSVMTPIGDDGTSHAGGVGEGGIVNGLYSVRIRLLDGIDGGLSGVMLLHEGRILGGDAFFYYLGAYTSANGRWKGQIVNQEHTPAKGENPIFGGYEVGIGFSGTCDTKGAQLEATALAGKRSLRLTASLELIRPA